MRLLRYSFLYLFIFIFSCVSAQKTVTIVCSQGFQGPELWDRHELPIDKKGYVTIFDGKTFAGWRGYGKTYMPSKWKVQDGAIFFDSKAQGEGGDIIFAHQFGPDFEFEMEWKIAEGGNSGIFYLAREVANEKGGLEPIYISAPECQVLDNERHPDAKLGKDNNRQSSSLYDMIPAKPQKAKPAGQWNKVRSATTFGLLHGQHSCRTASSARRHGPPPSISSTTVEVLSIKASLVCKTMVTTSGLRTLRLKNFRKTSL